MNFAVLRLTPSPATFPDVEPDPPALQTAITDYHPKLTARESGASLDMLAFTVALHALEDAIAKTGN